MEYIPTKTILEKRKQPQWFNSLYNMNIYRGCSHGCIYCDSRSHCYQIEDFDRVRAKKDVLPLLEDELRRKKEKGVVATGAMSDPYNPHEKHLQLTRDSLSLLAKYHFGVGIATKSDLIVRDIDVLQAIKQFAPVIVKITITTPRDSIGKLIEPLVASSSERFMALESLSEANIYAGILMMPLLPWITDNKEDIKSLVQKAAQRGAKFIYPSFGLTMRDGQREYFYNALNKMDQKLVGQYNQQFGNNYYCPSPNANMLFDIFRDNCEKYGVLYKMTDIIRGYQQPYKIEEQSLFDNLS